MIRNQTRKRSVIWHTLQYAVFASACIWLLYHLQCSLHLKDAKGCDYTERKLTEGHVKKPLGRKGNIGLDLYRTDLVQVQEAERNKHGAHNGNDSNQSTVLQEFSRKEGDQIPEQTKAAATSPMADSEGIMLIAEKPMIENNGLRKRAVILKADRNVLKRDSGPSRRTDIQVQSLLLQGLISGSRNQTKDIRASGQICVKNSAKKLSLKEIQSKAVHGKAGEMKMNEFGKARRRELLFMEKWMNTTGF